MTLFDPSQHACDVYPQSLPAASATIIPIMYLCIIVFMQGLDLLGLNMCSDLSSLVFVKKISKDLGYNFSYPSALESKLREELKSHKS